MRISDALRRLRTAGNEISGDEIIDIDFLTDYPIVEDPDLKHPMLFYCSSGDWHFISGIVGKRYRQALQSTDILDNYFGRCREQIKLFEDAYFKDTNTSVFDDLRRGRIPLTNFFRYYSYWLFIASKSRVKQFSYETVKCDFRIHVNSALNQYQTLLTYVCNKLTSATPADGIAHVFWYLYLLQKVTDIPTVVIDETMRMEISKMLEEISRVEGVIEDRIANEFPSATEKLSEAIKNFPAGESHEVPSTYDWRSVSIIETAYPDLVDAYIRASRDFQSLNSLASGKQGNAWYVSSDVNFDAAFNAVDARDAVEHISLAESESSTDGVARFLFSWDMTGGEENALLSELRRFMTEPPFHDSMIHQIALVHLFLPFYVADIQSEHQSLVRLEFVKAVRGLKSCLAATPRFNVEELLSIVVRCETAWQDWNVPIGVAYCLLDNMGKDLLTNSVHDSARLLTTHCGEGRGRMLEYLGRSRLCQLYTDSAKRLKDVTRNGFAREHFSKLGFIINDVSVDVVQLISSASIQMSTNAVGRGPIPSPTNMASGWVKYHERYSILMGDKILSDSPGKFIHKMAKMLAKQIEESGFQEKSPIRNYTAPDVPKGLAGLGDIIDVLIQRRAILRWAQVCELRRDDKAKSQNRKRFFQQMGYGIGNLESYSNYFNALGLKLENLYVPDESGFFAEELTWLASFRTRK